MIQFHGKVGAALVTSALGADAADLMLFQGRVGARDALSTAALTRSRAVGSSGEDALFAQAERPAARNASAARAERWRSIVMEVSSVECFSSVPMPALITAHGAGTTLTGWENRGISVVRLQPTQPDATV